ncbi:hypothetical protein ELI_2991 [Eubacterium callanderi]|uniref:Uncharacterized protein n=1 Tax=Eubacterium callanderi TaxID=53442 RepID=E3GEH4_9FIRM|nr:hypothetical protein ELI_2991 [Eubacterium callanderi]
MVVFSNKIFIFYPSIFSIMALLYTNFSPNGKFNFYLGIPS